MSLFSELKRRNVLRVAIAYLAACWLLIQVVETLFPIFGLSDALTRLVVISLFIGFPLVLIFSWLYELTPEGLLLQKDVDRSRSNVHHTGKKLDRAIIVVLTLALGYFSFDKFVLDPSRDTMREKSIAQQARSQALTESYGDKSIAVLPFVNMSSDPEQDYFSDGISEDLLNMLAQLPRLRVAARTSSFQFRGANKDIGKIGAALNVAHILEGSVRRSGNKLRITAQLVGVRDGFNVWSDSYDRELDDIFTVQDEIASAISDALKVELALDAATDYAAPPTAIKSATINAYEAYLQGRELSISQASLEEAIRHFEHSLRLDNNFAPAHAELAISMIMQVKSGYSYGTLSLDEVKRKAIPHLNRAEELQPNLAQAHKGRAILAIFAGDPESAITHARQALASNPSSTGTMNVLLIAMAELGRYEELGAGYQQLLAIDPLSVTGRSNYVHWLIQRRRFEEGHEIADQLVAQGSWWGFFRHAQMLLFHEGKLSEGLSWGLKGYVEDPGNVFSNRNIIAGLTLARTYDEARRIDDSLDYIVDIAEAHFDRAVRTTQRMMQLDSDNAATIAVAANVLYVAGRVDEALPLYERLRDFVPPGRPIRGSSSATMALAFARRKAGDENGAQAAAQMAKQNVAALRSAGQNGRSIYASEALIAAFEDDPNRAIDALRTAIQLGLRGAQRFNDPIFEDLWDEPRFVALQQELDAILEIEHDKVLQLICFNNPVPDGWQPLPETCEGVEEQLVL